MYSTLVRPLLFRLPPEVAHDFTLHALALADIFPEAASLVRRATAPPRPALRTRAFGLDFDNPIGLGAGLDKDAQAVVGFFALGLGFVEVGTVTPRPQPGNPQPRLFRLPEARALVNRMGFNNAGAAEMASHLRELPWRPGIIGVNLGKNKDTPNEGAAADYADCAERLAPYADYLAVNLSSPNTPGLRALQEPKALERILRAVREAAPGRPALLKLSPDLDDAAVDAAVDVARACGIAGLICTNTTVERPFAPPLAAEAGGLSGRPLFERSTAVLARAFRRAEGRLALVGVGGVFSAEDAWRKIGAGAALVQLYSGLVYEGPGLPRRILRELDLRVRQAGLTSLSEAVGRDVR